MTDSRDPVLTDQKSGLERIDNSFNHLVSTNQNLVLTGFDGSEIWFSGFDGS